MRYEVKVCEHRRGVVYVEADSAEEAVKKGKEAYKKGNVTWYKEEVANVLTRQIPTNQGGGCFDC